MAKYTETLAEYIDGGGALPSSSFALITDFEDLFKERFCGCEIGFETEALFNLKLDMKARLVMPIYARRLAILEYQYTGIETTPTKYHYEKRQYGKTHSETESDGNTKDLPFDSTTAKPSTTNHIEGSADADAHTDEVETKDHFTIDERLRAIDELNKRARSVVEECLEEFKPLFMGVY